MLLHFGLDTLAPEWTSCVACLGNFDGVHLGHRTVIRHAVEKATSSETPCVILTFDRHPLETIRPEAAPLAISTLDQKLGLLEGLGVAVCVVLPFDKEFANTSADDFLNAVLKHKLKAAQLVIGHDFACGKNREATPEWLKARIETEVIPPVESDGHRVSSSGIRQLIAEGDVSHASRLLDRPVSLSGVVVSGQKLGRKLGYPTLNLALSTTVVKPGDGVYSGSCTTPSGTFRAAINVGTRPAVGGGERTVEAYLLDYAGDDLYGCSVELEFRDRLRDEKNFDSLEDLTDQIRLDVEAVRSAR